MLIRTRTARTLFILTFAFLATTGSTEKRPSVDLKPMICTFQGRVITERDPASKQDRVAIVLNQRSNLETTVELTGKGLSDVAENRGFRVEAEVEVKEDILGGVTFGKFRRLKRVLDPYEDTQEYFTSKSVREACRNKKGA